MVVNQNNGNIFLRIDGSNKMQNSLAFNKELNKDNRMIKYLSSITNDGDLSIDAKKIYLGNQSAVKENSNVVVNDLTIHSMGDKPLTSLLNSMPIGFVGAYAGVVAPWGYLECNGASFNINKYPKLYQALGSNKLPDLRGVFIRGWDHDRGVDTNRGINSYQNDALQNITGKTARFVATPDGYSSLGVFNTSSSGTFPLRNINRWTHYWANKLEINFDAAKVARTANETRPKNIALMYIIKHD